MELNGRDCSCVCWFSEFLCVCIDDHFLLAGIYSTASCSHLNNLCQVVHPPVLPNLQGPKVACGSGAMQPQDAPFAKADAFARAGHDRGHDIRLDFSLNRMSVGELFFGFFDFYVNQFSWGSELCSIRDGVRSTAPEGWWGNHISIADPFEAERNLGRTISADQIERLWHEFDSQFQRLEAIVEAEFALVALSDGRAAFGNWIWEDWDSNEFARATVEHDGATEVVVAADHELGDNRIGLLGKKGAKKGQTLGKKGAEKKTAKKKKKKKMSVVPPSDGCVYLWDHAPWNHIIGAVRRDTKQWIRLLDSKGFQTVDEAFEGLNTSLSGIIERYVKKSAPPNNKKRTSNCQKTKLSGTRPQADSQFGIHIEEPRSLQRSQGDAAPAAQGFGAQTSNCKTDVCEHFQLTDGNQVPLKKNWRIQYKAVRKMLRSIDVSESPSSNVAAFWKNTADETALTLTKLFRFIVRKGCCPSAWKHARHNRGDGVLPGQSCLLVALENSSLYFEKTITAQYRNSL